MNTSNAELTRQLFFVVSEDCRAAGQVSAEDSSSNGAFGVNTAASGSFGVSAGAQRLGAEDSANEEYDMLILLVEDNMVNQIIAAEILQSRGYSVDVADNGQDALDMIALKPYKLVLMDIQMPVMDGFACTRKLREMPQYRNLPILAMTAHALTGDREKSLNAGMNDHIAKPIDVSELFEKVHYWIAKTSG